MKTAEDYLKDKAKSDDWHNLFEDLNDKLWTNNVIHYMEEYASEVTKEKDDRIKELEEIIESQEKNMSELKVTLEEKSRPVLLPVLRGG